MGEMVRVQILITQLVEVVVAQVDQLKYMVLQLRLVRV
jgi:hypothetical protein